MLSVKKLLKRQSLWHNTKVSSLETNLGGKSLKYWRKNTWQ